MCLRGISVDSEGNEIGAPVRRVLDWESDTFTDPIALDKELRRVFDICHGCRRCFNLCETFPRLFKLIDDGETGELESVDSDAFKPVVDACTLCDLCFMTKCPYVPPHEFNLDFPHLMLRYRVTQRKQGHGPGFIERQLAKTDRNGRWAGTFASISNWLLSRKNRLTRPLLAAIAKIDVGVELPKFHAKSLEKIFRTNTLEAAASKSTGKKAAIFATCYANFNSPDIGKAAVSVLQRNGVAVEVVYPECCGMPNLEGGDISTVAAKACRIAESLLPWLEDGYDIVVLTPSCGLMLKFEWPLIVPGNKAVLAVSNATKDISEYIVDLSKKEGLADGLRPIGGNVTLHLACHARAQNMGPKAAEMLRLIPESKVTIVQRCSGHGGTFGVKKETHNLARKSGTPTAQQVAAAANTWVASECPLAGKHIMQMVNEQNDLMQRAAISKTFHPIELVSMSYNSK